ncbi:toprim domain-containing protein [Marispirochaeta sp.]|uniref:toprim domain-containing protein n=1 Tax=Marispirochaeta sp. TaxID=2038653 RepID=UPI0029C96D16|nr:toprim domain-containing protein [Marispirochaeta sp.]
MYRDGIIIVESILDAASLLHAGVKNVIPAYGTYGVSDEFVRRFTLQRVQKVIVAFDNDEAGKTAAEKTCEIFRSSGIAAVTIVPPSGVKDWNEALCTGLLDRADVEGRSAASDDLPGDGPHDTQHDDGLAARKESGVWHFTRGGRRYRALGVKELFVASLRINLRLETENGKYLDNVDLYSARSRGGYAAGAAESCGMDGAVVQNDLLAILDSLEEVRDAALRESELDAHTRELTEEEKALGLELLASPDLFERILSDTEMLGYGGEDVNKLLVYLAASSRKLDDPISVIVVSESASGKSFLVDTIRKLIPDEDVVAMTSLSDQALQYLPADALLHKFLVMGEAVHGQVVEHQVREMLSAKELRRLVTMKDPKTGELSSRMVVKKVIVSAVMSSTNTDINPENASRSFVINTDESAEHTKRIHELQRRKYSLERYRQKETVIPEIIRTHHAAQRLLKGVRIVNGFAPHLDFPAALMRSRRDHERFIDLIAGVCFLRQYQKEKQVDEGGIEFIECDLEDYTLACRIMKETLPSTLTNFPKHAQALYERLRKLIRRKANELGVGFHEVAVTQREIREETGVSQMSVKRSLRTLADWEYVQVSGLRKRGMRNGYRILEDRPLDLVDLSMIPGPEEMKEKL